MRRGWALAQRLLADPLAPTVVLSLILVFSLYARVLHLGQPCTSPCKQNDVHTLIFDENYYVNAARVIDHIEPPAGAPYHGAPKGEDPNAEHPQLAKLVIAAGIEVFGDNARGWRIGSVLFGLIGMVALFAMVRAAGGGAWLAVGAVGVMSMDNLLLVHGRIATLEIYAVSMMLVAMAFYLRGWWLPAGIALGVAGCMKEVALLLVVVVVLLETLRWIQRRWTQRRASETYVPSTEGIGHGWRTMTLFLAVSAVSLLGLLWLLDVLVPAYDPVNHVTYAGSPFTHLFHIYHYAQLLKAKPHEVGITSSPWQWLLDEHVIDYAKVAVNSMANGHLVSSRATVYFRGAINPFIIFVTIPALFAAIAAAWRKRDGVAALGACWVPGNLRALCA